MRDTEADRFFLGEVAAFQQPFFESVPLFYFVAKLTNFQTSKIFFAVAIRCFRYRVVGIVPIMHHLPSTFR